jgi:hypothetical protein
MITVSDRWCNDLLQLSAWGPPEASCRYQGGWKALPSRISLRIICYSEAVQRDAVELAESEQCCAPAYQISAFPYRAFC